MKREDFPIFKQKIEGKPLIYLDSAATTQKPRCVIDALTDFYACHYGTVHRAIYSLASQATQKYDEVRAKVAQFIHANSPSEIVFTRGTTDSINLIAGVYASILEENDEIIISEMEHHSNIVPWQLLCQKTGAKLKVIPVNDDAELCLDVYAELLSSRTKLVAVAHIANSTGTVNPIQTIIEMAHAHGAKVLIDAAQSAAHFRLDVQELGVDYLAFSGHKMYGPTGIGILYGKYALLHALPPVQGGGDMIETVTLEKTTYAAPPLKFEAGTPPIAEVIGLGAAIDYLESVGLENIKNWEHELLQYATEKLSKISSLRIIGTAKEKSGIISFIIEGVHHLDLTTMLDLKGIAIRSGHHCAQPLMKRFGVTGTNRISFALYNTKSEIDQLIESLNSLRQLLLNV